METTVSLKVAIALSVCSALLPSAVRAEEVGALRIVTIISTTGAASTLGIPEQKAVDLFTKSWLPTAKLPFGVSVVSYDDSSDPTKAVSLVRKAVEEDRADVVVCCSTAVGSLAIIDTVTNAKIPMISMASPASIVEPANLRQFTYQTPTSDRLMAQRIAGYMKKQAIKTVAFFGVDDSYGEAGLKEMTVALKSNQVELIETERFAKQDTNFTPQALRIKQSHPGAVYIHGIPPSEDLALEALKRVGYTGPIYLGAGASIRSFITLGKASVEGAIVGVGALNVYDQLSETNPLKETLTTYAALFDGEFGKGTVDLFSGQAWDALMLSVNAFQLVKRDGMGDGDIAATRFGIRDALNRTRDYVGVNGVYNLSAEDHNGLDSRSTFLAKISGGHFVLIEE